MKPTFKGLHYKFTILLPVAEKLAGKKAVKEVFTTRDLEVLGDLFNKDFEGATYFEAKSSPIIRGTWVGRKESVVVNWHARIDVYTRPSTEAVEYFTELKARLLQHAKGARHAEQKDIVIEQTDVAFIPKRPISALRTESEEKLKYLRK